MNSNKKKINISLLNLNQKNIARHMTVLSKQLDILDVLKLLP